MSAEWYRAIGGTEGCHRLSTAFYARVARDPVLRPLFPGKTMTCAIEEFTAFLVQFLGGPAEDTQRRWWMSLRESHARFRIGPRERAAWLRLMGETLGEAPIEDEVREALRNFFAQSSAYVIRKDAHGQDALHGDLAERWDAQKAIDETMAAIREGDAERAIVLAGRFRSNRPTLAGLLAMMLRQGGEAFRDYVRRTLIGDPLLIRERFAGRPLLYEAAAAGDLGTVRVLLDLGADPNVQTTGGHAPLYAVANECKAPDGAAVVRVLVQAGAKVDACDGVQRCTPLHMAARRGNVAIAAALLECGADAHAKDRGGNTPLQRALNCRRPAVAALLRA